jgi:transcription elongation factor SPT4
VNEALVTFLIEHHDSRASSFRISWIAVDYAFLQTTILQQTSTISSTFDQLRSRLKISTTAILIMASGGQRNLRACMVCSIVMTASTFLKNGCPNCESVLSLQGSNDAVQECTSQVFDGLITLGDPTTSWVAKWQRLTNYVPGVYAVKVVGQLPGEILNVLEDNGIRYVPRDGSAADDEMGG